MKTLSRKLLLMSHLLKTKVVKNEVVMMVVIVAPLGVLKMH